MSVRVIAFARSQHNRNYWLHQSHHILLTLHHMHDMRPQAPNIAFDSIRVHPRVLNQSEIAAISNGGSAGDDLHSAW